VSNFYLRLDPHQRFIRHACTLAPKPYLNISHYPSVNTTVMQISIRCKRVNELGGPFDGNPTVEISRVLKKVSQCSGGKI
jgi:hypothetical protein